MVSMPVSSWFLPDPNEQAAIACGDFNFSPAQKNKALEPFALQPDKRPLIFAMIEVCVIDRQNTRTLFFAGQIYTPYTPGRSRKLKSMCCGTVFDRGKLKSACEDLYPTHALCFIVCWLFNR